MSDSAPACRAGWDGSLFPPAASRKQQLPDLFDEPEVDLSLIVPAYNEEERLPIMLADTMKFLEQRRQKNPCVARAKRPCAAFKLHMHAPHRSATRSGFTYELLIVDDGSRDGTSRVVLEATRQHGSQRVRLMRAFRNRGKGGAVRAVRTTARCCAMGAAHS